jgi:hypothetical protein
MPPLRPTSPLPTKPPKNQPPLPQHGRARASGPAALPTPSPLPPNHPKINRPHLNMVGRGPPDPPLFPLEHTTPPGASRGHALPAAAAPIQNAPLRPTVPPPNQTTQNPPPYLSMVGRGPPDPPLFPLEHTTSPGASRGHALPAAAAPIRNAHLRPATPPWRDDLRVVRSFRSNTPPPRRVQRPTPTGRCRANSKYPPPPISPLPTKPPKNQPPIPQHGRARASGPAVLSTPPHHLPPLQVAPPNQTQPKPAPHTSAW